MLAIKLKPTGRRNQRTFRVIVQEDREKLGGKNAEDLGWFNPHTNQFKVNKARVEYWVKNGAQATESATKLLKRVKDQEVGGYEARQGRKKKKVKAGEVSSPDASASKEPSAEGGATEVAGSGETPQAEVESVEETAPETSEMPAVEEIAKEVPVEEAPISSQDSPEEQNRESSTSDTEQSSEEVGIEESKTDE